jgi:hypothetical protein
MAVVTAALGTPVAVMVQVRVLASKLPPKRNGNAANDHGFPPLRRS